MKLTSSSWTDGGPIPERYAAGKPDGTGQATFSDNVNPQLAWSDVPELTQSFVLICSDPDVPSKLDDLNKPDREIAADLPRVDFYHWLLVDLPPPLREIAEGEFSNAFTPRGKPGPQTTHGARQGLNDYTGFMAGGELEGQYFGYDGPFPPFNDSIVHHYVFTLYALSVSRAPIDGTFTGAQLREAIRPHVLAEASFSGTYTTNARLRG